jgi:CDGSH-type Zn-finger protein
MSRIEIKATQNGPYRIPGNATYEDAEGNQKTTEGRAVFLCRCGHSGNKPFCDGSHKRVGFEAPGVTLEVEE